VSRAAPFERVAFEQRLGSCVAASDGGDPRRAIDGLGQLLAELDESDAPQRVAAGRLLGLRGRLHLSLCQLDDAVHDLAAALDRLRDEVQTAPDIDDNAAALTLALLQLELAEPAMDCAAFSLARASSRDDALAHAGALISVGACGFMLGDAAMAEQSALEALGLLQQAGRSDLAPRVYSNLLLSGSEAADALAAEGRTELAMQSLQRLARFAAQGQSVTWVRDSFQHARWRANRAGWLMRVDRGDEARRETLDIEPLARAHGWTDVGRHVTWIAGRVAFAQQQWRSANEAFGRCVAWSPQPDAYRWVSRSYEGLAEVRARLGDADGGRRYREAAAAAQEHSRTQRESARRRLALLQLDVRQWLAEADRQRLAQVLVDMRQRAGA
jgi:hypothetical protein